MTDKKELDDGVNQPLTIEDVIKKRGRSYGIIRKDLIIGDEVGGLEIPDSYKKKLVELSGGRHEYHLLRLLGPERSEVERSFGLTYLDNYDTFKDALEKTGKEMKDMIDLAITNINGESIDTTMWWTYAPYLFEALKENGLSEKESFEKTFLWAAVERDRDDIYNVHLKGLEQLSNGIKTPYYILGKDSKDISHVFTREDSKRIAKLLIEK